jgi:hypothetical protein
MRLISPTYISSDHTLSMWWSNIDRDAPGRGEALRFILVNSWYHRSTMRSSRRAYSSRSGRRHSQRHTTMIWIRRVTHDDDLEHPVNNKKSGARRWSWAPDSWTRSATHNDDHLRVSSEPQELSDHVSRGGQATSYDKSDWWSDTTIDCDFIDDYPIIRVSPHWDSNNEAWRISNWKVINSFSKYSMINKSTTIKSGSSSSSRTPLQLRLQCSPTTGVNLRDKLGLML